jgi:hypothetical protein
MSSAPVVVAAVDHFGGPRATLRCKLRTADVDVSELPGAAERQLEQTMQEALPAPGPVEAERLLVQQVSRHGDGPVAIVRAPAGG